MSDCVLCDWTFDSGEKPVFVVTPEMGGRTFVPWRWDAEGPRPVQLSERITPESTRSCAVVTHWAREHPEHLTRAIGLWNLVALA